MKPFRSRNPAWPVHLVRGPYRLCRCDGCSAYPLADSGSDCAEQGAAFFAERAGYFWFCGCGRSATLPLCDGQHNQP